MASGIRKLHDFCWINMLTPQPDAARTFFTKVLNWTYGDMEGGMGHFINVNGKVVGGIFDLNSPQTPPGTPPCIGVMVKVESADATGAKVASLGGKAMPAFDIFDKGRMAVCFDLNGANFDVWQPRASQGMEADSMHHGAPSWFESLTSDPAKATKFYCDLFGWKYEVMAMSNHMEYTIFKLGDDRIAGMMKITPDMGPIPPLWSVYFTVTDADVSTKLAQSLGAKVCVPVTPIPNVGRFSVLTSPQGVTFCVIQYQR
jgi:predicted enzyme related to lactoylglutathione lyase